MLDFKPLAMLTIPLIIGSFLIGCAPPPDQPATAPAPDRPPSGGAPPVDRPAP